MSRRSRTTRGSCLSVCPPCLWRPFIEKRNKLDCFANMYKPTAWHVTVWLNSFHRSVWNRLALSVPKKKKKNAGSKTKLWVKKHYNPTVFYKSESLNRGCWKVLWNTVAKAAHCFILRSKSYINHHSFCLQTSPGELTRQQRKREIKPGILFVTVGLWLGVETSKKCVWKIFGFFFPFWVVTLLVLRDINHMGS